MSIKSDKWIRRMAEEHGMIEPFQGSQVRQPDPNAPRVISYGVSSYGYDVRCADDARPETNYASLPYVITAGDPLQFPPVPASSSLLAAPDGQT